MQSKLLTLGHTIYRAGTFFLLIDLIFFFLNNLWLLCLSKNVLFNKIFEITHVKKLTQV